MPPTRTRDDDLDATARDTATGDRPATEALFRALSDDVWRYCHALLGDSELAFDASQETFVRLIGAIRRWRGDAPVRVFVLVLARRACAEVLRKERRHRDRTADRVEADRAVPADAGAVEVRRLVAALGPAGEVQECKTMSEHETVRVWLSARVDGEVADDSLARAHLAACEACRAWATSLELLTAAQVAAASDVVPDVAATARRQLDTARPSVRERSGRLVLVLAGLSGLALAAASVTALPTDVAAAHVGLDLIGFKVAIAVGYLVAAVDPRRYGRGLVAVAATAALVLLLPSASTVAGGAADPLAEAAHLSVLGGLLGLALLVDELRDGPRRRPATPACTGTVGA